MTHLVTGGAGFIGRHLVRFLASKGHKVTFLDDGRANTRSAAKELQAAGFTWIDADVKDPKVLAKALVGVDVVWHLAANPDVRGASTDPQSHFDENVVATWNLLEAMRKAGVKSLRFCSTSTIYGEATEIPTPENYGPLHPISIYGAAKLACEALISSHCASFGMDAQLYRFANVVGPEATHGVIVDFIAKLKANPKELEILGNGKQTKSYVHVEDTIAAMYHLHEKLNTGCAAFNVGSKDWIDVDELARIVAREMKLTPKLRHTGGTSGGGGWVGDVPKMHLATDELAKLGWKPNYSSADAVAATVQSLLQTA